MKNQPSSFKTRFIFIAALFLGSSLLFSGCENFLKGSDVKQRLDEKVAYANAKSCTVYIHANDREGTFLSSGEKVFKVGFAEELQFNLNAKDFSFVKFKAVSANDNSIISDEYISFSALDYNWQTGIFKVSVKILKARNDIMIQPLCREKTENVAPEVKELFAAKEPVSIETKDTASCSKILPGTNSNYSADYVYEHHTGASVNILGTYFEGGSGFACLNVKDRIIKDKNAVSVVRSKEWDTQNIYKESDQTDVFTCQEDDIGNTTFCLKYTISGGDGLHELLISAVDECGNESDVSVIQVFKDTNLLLDEVYPFNYNPYKDYPGFNIGYDNFNFDRVKFNAELKTIKILSSTQSSYYDATVCGDVTQYYYMNETVFKSRIFGNVDKKPDSLTFWCEYKGKKARMNYNSADYYWYLALDESIDIEGLELKITVEDDCGNSAQKSYAFAGKPIVSGVEPYSGYTHIDFASNYNYTRFWQLDINNYGKENQTVTGKWAAVNGFSTGTVQHNNDPKAFYALFMNGCLTGPFYETPFTAATQFTSNSPDVASPVIESASFGEVYCIHDSNGIENYCYPINIYFSNSIITYGYDTIAVNVSYSAGSKTILSALSEKSNILTIYDSYLSSDFVWQEGAEYTITAVGIKGNKASVPAVQTIACLSSAAQDKVPPCLLYIEKLNLASLNSINQNLSSAIKNKLSDYKECFTAYDSESGLDEQSVYYILNDKKYAKDIILSPIVPTNQSYIFIPVWDVDGPAAEFSIYVRDKNNNERAVKENVSFFYPPAFSIKKESGNYTLSATDSKEWINWETKIYKLNSANDEWEQLNVSLDNPSSTQDSSLWTYKYTDVSLSESGFYKVVSLASDSVTEICSDSSIGYCRYGYSDPVIYYVGNASTKNQFFDGYNGVLIASDQPVFVQTFTTKTDYDICKNWTYDKWNHNHRHISEKYMQTDSNLQMYEIDINDIEQGECYVVVAHYADNTIKLSSVKQKIGE